MALTCEFCGKSDETVMVRNCGYMWEVYGMIRRETVCDACERQHLDDT